MATKNVRNYLKLYRKYVKLSLDERDTDKGKRLWSQLSTIWTNQLSFSEMDEIEATLCQDALVITSSRGIVPEVELPE